MNDRNPIIKFDPNARVQVFFPDINSRKITTKFGERTVYDVQSQGQSFALFADDRLHSMILASGLKSNLVLEISRNQQGDQKWTEVTNTETGMSIDSRSFQYTPPPQPQQPQQSQYQQPQQQPAQYQQPQPQNKAGGPDWEDLSRLMGKCYEVAKECSMKSDTNLTSEDMRATAITLFIECNKKGVLPPKETPQSVNPPQQEQPPIQEQPPQDPKDINFDQY